MELKKKQEEEGDLRKTMVSSGIDPIKLGLIIIRKDA